MKLIFPDGYSIPFVDSDEMVDYVACLPLRKPIPFHGRISEHMQDWKLALSPNGLEYRSMLAFEPEVRSIPVEFISQDDASLLRHIDITVPFGIYRPEEQVWEVSGLDLLKLDEPFTIDLGSGHSNMVMVDVQLGESSLAVHLAILRHYDLGAIFRQLEQLTGESPRIDIHNAEGKLVATATAATPRGTVPAPLHKCTFRMEGTSLTPAVKFRLREGLEAPGELPIGDRLLPHHKVSFVRARKSDDVGPFTVRIAYVSTATGKQVERVYTGYGVTVLIPQAAVPYPGKSPCISVTGPDGIKPASTAYIGSYHSNGGRYEVTFRLPLAKRIRNWFNKL